MGVSPGSAATWIRLPRRAETPDAGPSSSRTTATTHRRAPDDGEAAAPAGVPPGHDAALIQLRPHHRDRTRETTSMRREQIGRAHV